MIKFNHSPLTIYLSFIIMFKKIISFFSKKSSLREPSSAVINIEKKREIENFRQSINQRLNQIFNDNPQKIQGKPDAESATLVHNRRRKKENRKNLKKEEQPNRRRRSQYNQLQNKKKPEPNKVEEKIISTATHREIPEVSVFNSDNRFTEMGLNPQLNDCLTAHNFIYPSKAQEQSIPVILEKKNLICSSETGSGKTLAFIIPILERFLRKEIDQACVLTPTREIAIQIEAVLKPLADILRITTGLAIGGMDMLLQKKILREYPQILIATPGRLVDVSLQGLVWLNYTSIVVLDEVDRMLDMGFEKEISTLFELFHPQAQILMFTATMNAELEKLSQNYVKDYQLVTIGETMKTKASIEHLFISLSNNNRYQTLKHLLQRKREEKVLIFFNSIDETIKIYRQLKSDRFSKINCLHSRKSQDERNQVMTAFRENRINHLLTTDVLARGIDIPNIDIVVNYELPRDSEDYVHRIGRTGRADFLGKALSFVNKKDEIKLKRIKKLIKSDQGFNFIGINELKYF